MLKKIMIITVVLAIAQLHAAMIVNNSGSDVHIEVWQKSGVRPKRVSLTSSDLRPGEKVQFSVNQRFPITAVNWYHTDYAARPVAEQWNAKLREKQDFSLAIIDDGRYIINDSNVNQQADKIALAD